jgi:hypothetical protein
MTGPGGKKWQNVLFKRVMGCFLHGMLIAQEAYCTGGLLHWRLIVREAYCTGGLLHGRLIAREAYCMGGLLHGRLMTGCFWYGSIVGSGGILPEANDVGAIYSGAIDGGAFQCIFPGCFLSGRHITGGIWLGAFWPGGILFGGFLLGGFWLGAFDWGLFVQGLLTHYRKGLTKFLPALVRAYNAGLSFALLLFLGHYSEYCIIVQFHHAFSIYMLCNTRREFFNLQYVLHDNFDWSTAQVLGFLHDSKIWGLLDWSM